MIVNDKKSTSEEPVEQKRQMTERAQYQMAETHKERKVRRTMLI